MLSYGSGPLTLAALRRQTPDAPRSFKVPGGDTIPYLAFFSGNLIVFWAGWDVNWKLFVAVAIGYALLAVFRATGNRLPLDWRAGASWVVPWLLGLALISYLGTFGGGRGVLGFEVAALVIAAFSAVIYVVALRFRLDPAVVAEHVEATRRESRDEEFELGAPA